MTKTTVGLVHVVASGWIAGLFALSVAFAGCSGSSASSARIDVTVEIDSALTLDTIHIDATAPGKPKLPKDLSASGKTTATWSIVIANPPANLTTTLVANGMRGTSSVVSNTAYAVVSPGQIVKAILRLNAQCASAPACTNAGETCDKGACVKIPTFGTGVDGGSPDSKPTGTGGTNAGGSGAGGTGTGGIGAGGTDSGSNLDSGTPDVAVSPIDGGADATTGMDAACVPSQTDPKNCGTCGHDCTALANVAPGATGIECRAGVCYVPASACVTGFGHCSARSDDGCEANLRDALNCGACGTKCDATMPLCVPKGTTVACGSSCAAPTGDMCGSSCVDLKSDSKNCGTCGHDCTTLPNVKAGATGVTCQAGVCNVPQTACSAGFSHCSTRPNDGCEANLTDAKTCGACTTVCAAPTPVCSSTSGSPKCTANCSGTTADICGTTCVNLQNDPKNCGTCGTDCTSLPHVKTGATGITCQAGVCSIPPAACASGFAHCSTKASDGCETDLSRPENCGQCGKACAAPTALCSASATNATPACSSSCVKPAPDLCVTKCVDYQTDPLNCGSCSHNCTTLPGVKAGAAGIECRSGACYVPASACVPGKAHCTTAADDGCETDLSSPSNCGKCGTKCAAPTALCSTTTGAPACSSSCVAPSPDLCGSQCVDLKTDTTNCGVCGHSCAALPNVKAGAAVQCVAGVCQIPPASCSTGFGHCTTSGDVACESALNACGGCGTLAGAPDAACGSCGKYVCSANKASVTCSDPGKNACGGCGTLTGAPDAACGSCGKYVCSTSGTSVSCSDPGKNACGGCGTLAGAPSAACGGCGKYTCSTDKTAVSCVGTPGPVSCSNNTPQSCNSNGQLTAGTACSGGTPTCSAGTCVCDAGKAQYCGGAMCCTAPATNAFVSCAVATACQVQCNTTFHACNGAISPCYSDTDVQHCSSGCLDCRQANAIAACGALTSTQCANTCIGTTLACPGVSTKPTCGSWDFESGGTESWVNSSANWSSNGSGGRFSASTARKFAGTSSLAIGHDNSDISASEYSAFTLDLCSAKQSLDLSQRRLSISVYLEPNNASVTAELNQQFNIEFFLAVHNAQGDILAFIDLMPPNYPSFPIREWVTATSNGTLNPSGGGSISSIEVVFRSYNGGWGGTGTVYADKIRIE